MPGDSCIVCGNSRKKNPLLKYHRFPSDTERRAQWLQVFKITLKDIKPHHRVCSRHFKDGNPENRPETTVGRRFASPVRKDTPRSKRAEQRKTMYLQRKIDTLQLWLHRQIRQVLLQLYLPRQQTQQIQFLSKSTYNFVKYNHQLNLPLMMCTLQ